MMRLRGTLAASLLLGAGGCTAIMTPAATTYPVTSDVDFSELADLKQGISCATVVFYMFPSGRASVADAARQGGIRQVRYVDNRYTNNVLWQEYCVVAYGQ